MAKKKHQGHYCKVCGEYKSNESFTGKGHKNHICKKCDKLSKEDREKMMNGEFEEDSDLFEDIELPFDVGDGKYQSSDAVYYDGTNSSEEFIFIVDFGDTEINSDQFNNSLLIDMRDSNDESIIGVLGLQQGQMVYNLYYGRDSQIDATITPSVNPLYIGYSDVFDTLINYQA